MSDKKSESNRPSTEKSVEDTTGQILLDLETEEVEQSSSSVKIDEKFLEDIEEASKIEGSKPDETKVSSKKPAPWAKKVKATPATKYTKWGDYEHSESDPDLEKEALRFMTSKGESSVIKVPNDLKELWPAGYKALSETAEVHGLVLADDDRISFYESGFKDRSYFDKPDQYLASLTEIDKTSLATMINIVVFTKLRPTEVVAKEARAQLAVSYSLSHILFELYKDHVEEFRRILKHPDGGKLLIRERLRSRFMKDFNAPDLLLQAVDRLLRCNARLRNVETISSSELRELQRVCLTTSEGTLLAWMKTETRKEFVMTEEPDQRGKLKKVKKEKLVQGKNVPNLPVRSEYLLAQEKLVLGDNDKEWNDRSKIYRELAEELDVHDPVNLSRLAKSIVDESYSLLSVVRETEKIRKQLIRARAAAAAGKEKITSSQWLYARDYILDEVHAQDFRDITADALRHRVKRHFKPIELK